MGKSNTDLVSDEFVKGQITAVKGENERTTKGSRSKRHLRSLIGKWWQRADGRNIMFVTWSESANEGLTLEPSSS